MFARDEWKRATEFHPHGDGEILERVVSAVGQARGRPVVILDLDETLYDAGPRNHAILKEWCSTQAGRSFSRVRDAIARLLDEDERSGEPGARLGYSMEDHLISAGVDPAGEEALEACRSLRDYWTPKFFSDPYLTHDRPYDGAPEFVKRLYAEGAALIYLTGRNGPGMGKGTRDNLARDGFPVEAPGRVSLILKPRKEMDDHDYKRKAAENVRGEGEIVAHFENEPRNLVMFCRAFPAALAVFMDTLCSENPAEPLKGVYRLSGYR